MINGYDSSRYAADATDDDLIWLCSDCAQRHAEQLVDARRNAPSGTGCEFCGREPKSLQSSSQTSRR